jgi:CRP-like cAMP-binding protein
MPAQVGTEMYFVVDGEVQVSQNDERLGYLGPGSFFGEAPMLEFIRGNGGNESTVRTRTVRSSRNSDLGFIRIEDVQRVLNAFPELAVRSQVVSCGILESDVSPSTWPCRSG